MSLGFLKEASSLASKLPCISPIAGMLLYAIQVQDVGCLLTISRAFFVIDRQSCD